MEKNTQASPVKSSADFEAKLIRLAELIGVTEDQDVEVLLSKAKAALSLRDFEADDLHAVAGDLVDAIAELVRNCADNSQRIASPAEIKSAIVRAGTSQSAIAEYLGVTAQSVWRVIHGGFRSPRIEAELAKITGCPVREPRLHRRVRAKTVWNGQKAST